MAASGTNEFRGGLPQGKTLDRSTRRFKLLGTLPDSAKALQGSQTFGAWLWGDLMMKTEPVGIVVMKSEIDAWIAAGIVEEIVPEKPGAKKIATAT